MRWGGYYNAEHMPPSQDPITSVPTPAPAQPPVQPPTPPVETSSRGWGIGIGLVAILVVGAGVAAYMQGAFSFGTPEVTQDASPKKIGILSFRQFNDVVAALKPELQRLGYEDAIFLDEIAVPGPTMMQDIDASVRKLVAADVDAIWASLEMQAKTAVAVTKELGRTDIPIVFMTRFHDPVEFGLIDSFTSSGNNSTGVATDLSEIVQRNLQFLKDIDPDLKKLGVFSDGFIVVDIGGEYFATLKREAPRFDIELVEYKTSAPPPQAEAEFHRIAATIKKGDIDGIFHIGGHFYGIQEQAESELAIRLGIPMVAPYEDLPNGGMFSFTDDFGASGKASAALLDKVLRGEKPSNIPVGYGANNVLTLMLARARAGGVVFPDSMLYIAKNKFEDESVFETDSLNR